MDIKKNIEKSAKNEFKNIQKLYDMYKNGEITFKQVDRLMTKFTIRNIIKNNIFSLLAILVNMFIFIPMFTNKFSIIFVGAVSYLNALLILLNIKLELNVRSKFLEHFKRGIIGGDYFE